MKYRIVENGHFLLNCATVDELTEANDATGSKQVDIRTQQCEIVNAFYDSPVAKGDLLRKS